MYESALLNPGEGRSFPNLYNGHVGVQGVGVKWYAGASCDSADCKTTSDGQPPHPSVEVFLNAGGPGIGGSVGPTPIGISQGEFQLDTTKPPSGSGVSNALFTVRFLNTGNVPIYVAVHRDLA